METQQTDAAKPARGKARTARAGRQAQKLRAEQTALRERQDKTDQRQGQLSQQAQEIWRIIKETERLNQEAARWREETERLNQEAARWREKTERTLAETAERGKAFDRRLNNIYGRFSNWQGDLVEALVEGKLAERLRERGIGVHSSARRVEARFVDDDGRDREREFDLILHNGADGDVVAVEVKTTLQPRDVERFVEKMRRFKRCFFQYRGSRARGAMGFLRSTAEARALAEREGLFLIHAAGNNAHIINATDFKPRLFD